MPGPFAFTNANPDYERKGKHVKATMANWRKRLTAKQASVGITG